MKLKKYLIPIYVINLLLNQSVLASDEKENNNVDVLETMMVSATPGKVQAVRDVQASVEVIPRNA